MTAALLLAALAMATPSTQDNLDSRWVPWLGCWELVDDERRDPLLGEADPTQGEDAPVRGLVCLNPSPDGNGVTVTTAADGESFLEETLIANGEKNPSAKGNCNGWQRTEWSGDGHRLFTSAELTCDENRGMTVSGLSMMVPRSTWLDIQIVESEHGRAVLIRRYRPANRSAAREEVADTALNPTQMRSLRRALSAPMTAEDIAEAASKVAPEALEAAVLEHTDGFELDAETLMRLDEAGLRPGLIDLMVALSYPEQFIVDSGSSGAVGGGFAHPGTYLVASGPYDYGYGDYRYRANRGLPYYAAPFSYYYWYAPYDTRFIVRPIAVREVRQGLVSNQGYAQVSPRPTGRRARRRGGSSGSSSSGGSTQSGGSRGSGSAVSSGGSAGSGSSVSRSGYSRGGSSGRTAKPKND